MSMQNNKSPGNDGQTKEFFVTFWEDIKDDFLKSCRPAKLKKDQGDPISTYIFILALEVLSFLVRNNKDIKGLNIFDHLFLYTAYADDTTFFLENEEPIEKLVKTFTLFSSFLGLKSNFSKCEICGLSPLKGMKMSVCSMQKVDLTKDAIKMLGIYFSYNINLMNQKNYYKISFRK